MTVALAFPALPASTIVGPTWFQKIQSRHLDALQKRGLPTRHDEQWKYTDISYLSNFKASLKTIPSDAAESTSPFGGPLVQFQNGIFQKNTINESLPENVIICSLADALAQHADLLQPVLASAPQATRYPFASLNLAYLQDGLFLYVPANTNVTLPIHCWYSHNHLAQTIQNRHIIIVGENSTLTFIEEFSGSANSECFANIITQIYAGANAQIHCYKIQNENATSTHIAHYFVEQAATSTVNYFNLSLGSRLAREEVTVNLPAAGAHIDVNGFYWLERDNQHIDNHLLVNHIAEHTSSNMFYKGVLNNKSTAVFNGKVHVHVDAQKTQAYQKNNNLLLSPNANIYTKPELEIYADDVKCAHGATVGQLDETALFYLCSRGIPQQQAYAMLIQAFAYDILGAVTHVDIRDYMQNLLTSRWAELTYA